MPKSSVLICLATCVLSWSGVAQAEDIDQIKTTADKQVRGKITESSELKVSLTSGPQGIRTISANEIVYVLFAEVESNLKEARVEYANGNYDAAEAKLKKITKPQSLSENGALEYGFLTAAIAAKQALAKGTPDDLKKAGGMLNKWVKAKPAHYSYYPAIEMIAELMTAVGLDPAPIYTELASAPWPEYKLRAFNSSGRTLLSQGKYEDAVKRFEMAMQISGDGGKASEAQRLQATLGKAEAIAKSGQVEIAKTVAEGIMKNAAPDDTDIYARVYNILGQCYLTAKQDKEALLAFLHVDLLYSQIPDAHAEALYNLSTLWNKVGKPDRAKQALQKLRGEYPNSVWAKKS